MSKDDNGLPRLNLPRLPNSFMRFDLAKQVPWLNTLLRQRGTPIKLTPHVICPCIKPIREGGSGEAVVDCPECSGTGYAYPGDPIEIMAPVMGSGASDSYIPEGTLSTNQIRVVTPSDVTIAEGDRLHLYRTIVPIRHVRRYHARMKGIRLPFDVQDVRSLVTNEPTTLKIRVLNRGTDYQLDRKKNILRFPERGVVWDQSIISGVFMASPYYIIDSLSSAFRGQMSTAFSKDGSEEWVKMPQSCSAVRADIWSGRFEKDVSQRGDVDSGEGS